MDQRKIEVDSGFTRMQLGVLALKAAHKLTELRFVIKQVDKVPLMHRRSKP